MPIRRGGASSLLVALACACAAVCAACGGEPDPATDAGPGGPDAGGSAPSFAACRELSAPAQRVRGLPATFTGSLASAGADLQPPAHCADVDAPFGTLSSGADQVIEVDDLTIGTAYAVRLDAAQDLSFYVVNGCSSATGPTADECLLFVDASADAVETGRFVATATTAWIVVDQFSARDPGGAFSVEVYPSECDQAADCGGGASACVDHRCAGCVTSFDCPDPALPVCDSSTHTCRAGSSRCRGDDVRENGDDGPAGATPLVLDHGTVGLAGHVCNTPGDEADFYRFDVTEPGEHWLFALAWLDVADLDLVVYDSRGERVGMSRHLMPESVALTYLPVGRYYVSVAQVDALSSYGPVLYALTAARLGADACQGAADCAAEYLTQYPRGECRGGACVRIDGEGRLKRGAACDSQTDCAAGGACASFLFTADADQRSVCGGLCTGDADCAVMGPGYVCTTYLPQNFCVQRCTVDDHCPVISNATPSPGAPWPRYRCQVSTGRCVR